ncbi:MAG TPA: hypothetical protein VEU96_17400 [Bryobacteraceae bacterium]|nr:hypothetical protein [Bryobacteraceae bacterium]
MASSTTSYAEMNASAPSEETRKARAAQVRQIYPVGRVLEFKRLEPVLKSAEARQLPSNLPQGITLLTPDPDDRSRDQLYVGSEPIGKQNWNYDPDMETLTFKQGSGDNYLAGNLRMVHDRTAAHGALQVGGTAYGVELAAKGVTYDMQTAPNAGYVAGDPPRLVWDPNSPRWKDAPWSPMNMRFTYGIETSGVIAGQKVYFISCVFVDTVTNETWSPDSLSYTAYMTMDFNLTFELNHGFTPSPDPFNPLASFQSLRFPYQFQVKMDPFGTAYEGAMLCGANTKQGTVYGVKGVTAKAANLTGIYQLGDADANAKPRMVAIHEGKMLVNQHVVANSRQNGARMEWDALAPEHADATGLDLAGYLEFSPDGSAISSGSGGVTGKRLTAEEAAQSLGQLQAQPNLADALERASTPAAQQLSVLDLINMSQFAKNADGQYHDKIQQQSMEDFYEILKYYMPEGLRKTFISTNPVDLKPPVKAIAQTPGWENANPATFYSSMSTAYLTATLSQWSNDPASKTLNGRRAEKWVSEQTGVNPVFNVQGPLLYAYRWIENNPTTQDYINDQKTNWKTYEPLIKADIAAWKVEILNEVSGISSQEQVDALLKQVDEIEVKALDRNYWTYAVFRYCTQTSFLNLLQVISFSGGTVDGSEFMQRTERTAAVLNVLDPTSFFTQQFGYTIQLFQISNILPQLLDYSGDLDDYSYAVNGILNEFIKKYMDSPDPDLAEAAKQLQELQQKNYVHELIMMFQQSSVANAGIYQWSKLALAFESKALNLVGTALRIAAVSVALAAVSFLIMGFATGQVSWGSLPVTEKVMLIGMGTGILAMLVLGITRRAIAVRALFQAGSGFWSGARLFFSPSLMTRAQAVVTNGIRGWLVQQGTVRATSMAAAAVGQAGSAARVSTAMRVTRFMFGRNMTQFVATRLGGILAVLGLVMSALQLTKSTAALETAANALFLAASALQIIAIAGGWAVGAFITNATIAMVASTMISILGVIGVIAMVAGAILLIIFLTKEKPSPVEEFAKNQAAQDGLYMPLGTDIDYFEFYQVGADPQKAGISLASAGDDQKCLKLSLDGSVSIAPLDRTASTAFYMAVDGLGRAQIVAPLNDAEKSPATRVLTMDAQGNLSAAEAIDDPKLARQQYWKAEMLAAPTMVDGNLQSAPFALYNDAYYANHNVKMYLAASGNTVVASPTRHSWLLQMVVTKPEGLKMANFALDTYDMDSSQDPGLTMPGSLPHTWSVEPPLPLFMTVNHETGTVSQVTGMPPSAMPTREYTLHVRNDAGADQAKFSITVQAEAIAAGA